MDLVGQTMPRLAEPRQRATGPTILKLINSCLFFFDRAPDQKTDRQQMVSLTHH